MRELPTGTVTFLFTDIEGSTRLAGALAERWPATLARHREIVRAALEAHGGIEVQTEGDGFFAVFASAPAAVAACARAQRGLHAEAWPPEGAVRVRMGLHTGEGQLDRDGLYVGADVHHAARVAAAGHGGQVLLTESTRALSASTLPTGTSLLDLGSHHLKDLEPELLTQLIIDGLPSDFAALRSLEEPRSNLPSQLTSFVGRERELAAVAELLAAHRLLTLTGPGGTGKTRLALQVALQAAPDFPGGTWFVPLEPVRDPSLVLPTVARALGIFPRPGEAPGEALASALRGRRLLVILDNLEQVVDAAGEIVTLLRVCPLLHVLVTSRAVLRVAGEQEYQVAGLPTPPASGPRARRVFESAAMPSSGSSAAELERYEAVRLFVARATAVLPGFALADQNAAAVAAITSRLQGLPLAIELAAARVRLLAPSQILERLEQQLAILASSSRDLPDRQRTLRGAIAWSTELLDDDQRRLLARLSTFRGGWTLGTAEAVVHRPVRLSVETLDGLADLVDQSLVRRVDEADQEARFDMLESVREFAAELLEAAGETASLREAHAAVFLALAREAAPHLQAADQRAWLDRLEVDHDNLRAALTWAVGVPDPATAVGLAFALWRFWQQRGYLDEARQRLDDMAGRGWDLDAELRARLAETLGGVAYWQGDLEPSARWYDEALEIRRAAADGGRESQRELANALYNRGYVFVAAAIQAPAPAPPPDPAARSMLEEALAIYERLDDAGGQADLLWGLGGYHMFEGSAGAAEADFRRSLQLHRVAGRQTMEAWSQHMLSTALVLQERYPEAGEASRQALRLFYGAGDVSGITLAFDVLSIVALAAGQRLQGARLWGAARQLQRVSGTGLAEWDARVFAMLPFGVRSVFDPDELAVIAAQGARLSLSDAVAYAFGEADPFAAADAGVPG
jgi:predicted ATPase/class 3 adenylate cyclase